MIQDTCQVCKRIDYTHTGIENARYTFACLNVPCCLGCSDKADELTAEPHHHGPLTLLSREDTLELESLLSGYQEALRLDWIEGPNEAENQQGLTYRLMSRCSTMIGLLQEQIEETSDV